MDIHVQVQDTYCTVITQAFFLTLRDTPANRKAAVVLLRAMTDEVGTGLLTLQQLSCLVGSANRQAASQHVEDFRACGQDMKVVLLRECTVDETVVEAVRTEVLQTPLATIEALRARVNARLERTDICWATIERHWRRSPVRHRGHSGRGRHPPCPLSPRCGTPHPARGRSPCWDELDQR